MNPPSFHRIQAEAFISWLNRLPRNPDPASAFEFWAQGKDFDPQDRDAIKPLASALLQQRARGELSHDCLTFNAMSVSRVLVQP